MSTTRDDRHGESKHASGEAALQRVAELGRELGSERVSEEATELAERMAQGRFCGRVAGAFVVATTLATAAPALRPFAHAGIEKFFLPEVRSKVSACQGTSIPLAASRAMALPGP
jgi:hypothetical protein